jgi:mannitol operon transcriptional antiterminator
MLKKVQVIDMERIKKSPRKGKILELLVHSESSITIDALVQKLAVSRRTIYREVSEINNTLLCYGLVIRNQKDQGLSLQGEPSLINKLCNFLNDGSEKTRDVDVNFRRKKLIADGLNYRSLEKLSYYSTVFKVSESTISSDLNYVEEWLKKHHLILERKSGKGIRVIGTEENIRLALKEFLCREVGSRVQPQIFELHGDPDKSIEQQIFQQLNIKPDYIFKTLKEYEAEFGG